MIVEDKLPVRLDRFLKRCYPLITQGVIQTLLRSKKVKVNSVRIKEASLRLNHGDKVEVFANLDEYSQETEAINPLAKSLSQKLLGEYKIFENDNFLVINKPAKLATQGGTKINICIDDGLKYLNSLGSSLKLVHRLDKETSGLILIAKGYDAAAKLSYGFREKKIYKTYLALVKGTPKQKQGIIKIEDEITKYKLLEYDIIKDVSLIEFKPITGKEHQIRRHALEIGTYILGDKKYGPNQKDKYMMLHSAGITIDKEIFGSEYSFNIPLPKYFMDDNKKPATYIDSNFDKLSSALKKNIQRRKLAKKNEEQDSQDNQQ
ncbi:ribosomal large subunit pseudouridine synthase [Candidatus Phycorickettsia trachydisci]|uniref:Ribosomal large subunit pseudouridine synthase C n=1 Tax=Candidatus Phycorickettsia trachydisci TaxID=2115978 RepID=A0A2P1P8T2_9RICK|nr:RluA family pseudouridine synthase [Candidatus Phycorickettsia trachydisci]AVP87671.1 ribosomal large subunit pseudouridine synthase [Candidatus Phycorickettsia trachydisci]